MWAEAAEAPSAVARLLRAEHEAFKALGMDLRQSPPQSLLTVARGSSEHAAHYLAYLVMARLGRRVTSLPMSLVTLYRANLVCEGLVALAFSARVRPRRPAPSAKSDAHALTRCRG